jgi:hypothetical protein
MSLDYSVETSISSFKEEVLNRLNTIYKEAAVNDLLFSGGMDSTFLLRSLLELGITPQLHTFSFSKDQTDYGSLQVKDQCKKFGVKEPKFFYVDKYDFFKHVDILTFEKGIAYPTMHCYLVDYYLSLMDGKKFFCGMACEYRTSNGIVTMNVAPPAIKHFNPDRLYGFECSETFFAYVNNPIFKDNYLKENPKIEPYGENIWHIRDLIYSDCYPDMGIIPKKLHDDAYISVHYHEQKLPVILKMHPVIFMMQPYRFNAQEYLSKKVIETLEEKELTWKTPNHYKHRRQTKKTTCHLR